MATWKKVIVSGSIAELNIVSASGGFHGDGSDLTGITADSVANSLTDGTGIADFTFDGSGAVSIATDDSAIVHDDLSGFVTNEHIDHSGVSISAGTGMTGGGTIASTRTLNVIGGDGITANAGDIDVTPDQTTITSVVNAGLEIGRDADNRIKFGTDNVIAFEVSGVDGVKFKASGEISASLLSVSNIDEVDSINTGTSANGNLDFTTAGTVNLRASNSTTHGLTLFGGVNGGAKPHIGTVTHEFLDFNVGSTNDIIVLAGAAGSGMLAGEARFIGHVSASSVSASGNIHASKFYGNGSGLTDISADSLGSNLQDGNGIVDFTFDGSAAKTVTLDLNGSTLNLGSSGVKVADAGITETQLHTSVAGAGLAGGGGTVLSVTVDDSSIEINSDTLRVKASGVTNAMLANDGITIAGVDTDLGGTITQATILAGSTAISGSGGVLAALAGSTVISGSAGVVAALTAGEGIDIAANGTISGESATATNLGIASFAAADFGVSSGAVTVKASGISNTQLAGSITNAKLSNSQITVGGTATSLGGTVTGAHIAAALNSNLGSVTFGDSNDIITIGNDLIVTGDLTVNGDLTTVATTNLSIQDKFITIASGSTSATDGGLVVSKQANGAGFGFGYDTATTRWAFQDGLAVNATGIVPDAFVSVTTGSTATPSAAPSYGGQNNGYGTMHVDTSTGDIFIYA